jgi:hypothetical protein
MVHVRLDRKGGPIFKTARVKRARDVAQVVEVECLLSSTKT